MVLVWYYSKIGLNLTKFVTYRDNGACHGLVIDEWHKRAISDKRLNNGCRTVRIGYKIITITYLNKFKYYVTQI
jgi:hypothetical protein